MAKKNGPKVGDIYCIELDDLFKCFFQYLGDDSTKRHTPVIRVFQNCYPINYEPILDEIINDGVLFFAHIAPDHERKPWKWYYIGNAEDEIPNNVKDLTFIDFERPKENYSKEDMFPEYGCWWIWKLNEKPEKLFPIPYDLTDSLIDGHIILNEDLINWIKYGYDRRSSFVYDVIKRKPLNSSKIFLKTQSVPSIEYFHFEGENLFRYIHISKKDGSIEFKKFEDAKGIKFWDRNWKSYEFIPKDKFESAWTKYVIWPKSPIGNLFYSISKIFK